MEPQEESIFQRYYRKEAFHDRFVVDPRGAVDVIVPIIHTTELWESNLFSFYREIPVNRLLIGDGGCTDNSIEIANKFPRVVVFDHKSYVSLGYSIRKLIEAVETEWFIYPHSDVYLPDGWFDTMQNHQTEYDWFGCPMRHTILAEYSQNDELRPYAGTQMGKKAAFTEGLGRIDDDYVYRQEDFVFADIVTKAGYKEGRIHDTFHYHQTMRRQNKWFKLDIRNVSFDVELSREEKVRAAMTHVRGIVKYLEPSTHLSMIVHLNLITLLDLKEIDLKEFLKWVRETNPVWLPHINMWKVRLIRLWMSPDLRNSLKNMAKGLLFRGK